MEKLTERYNTIGTIKVSGRELPVLDVKLMSDEEWQELAVKNAISNYTKAFGHAPESLEVATKWQRDNVAQMMKKAGVA